MLISDDTIELLLSKTDRKYNEQICGNSCDNFLRLVNKFGVSLDTSNGADYVSGHIKHFNGTHEMKYILRAILDGFGLKMLEELNRELNRDGWHIQGSDFEIKPVNSQKECLSLPEFSYYADTLRLWDRIKGETGQISASIRREQVKMRFEQIWPKTVQAGRFFNIDLVGKLDSVLSYINGSNIVERKHLSYMYPDITPEDSLICLNRLTVKWAEHFDVDIDTMLEQWNQQSTKLDAPAKLDLKHKPGPTSKYSNELIRKMEMDCDRLRDNGHSATVAYNEVAKLHGLRSGAAVRQALYRNRSKPNK